MTTGAFLAASYELPVDGPSRALLTVARLPTREAEALGAAFAEIDPWASYPYPASALAAYFAKEEPGAPRFSIRVGDDLAGAVGLRLDWLRGPYLQFLGLLPAHQGCGFGAAVLDWIEREAQASGQRNLWVLASDFNAGAQRFYERKGFVRVATIEALVAEGRSEMLLRKRL